MSQAMTGRLLSVARDVSGARERAASPSKLPVAAAKQVTDALHIWSGWQASYSRDNVHFVQAQTQQTALLLCQIQFVL